MSIRKEHASGQTRKTSYCTCDKVPDELAEVDGITVCPSCKGQVKFLSREEFERILVAEFERRCGTTNRIGVQRSMGSAH